MLKNHLDKNVFSSIIIALQPF